MDPVLLVGPRTPTTIRFPCVYGPLEYQSAGIGARRLGRQVVKPKPGGGKIEWPVSGWPRRGPLVVAFLVVLSALILALLFFGGWPADESPPLEPGVTAQPAEPE